MTRLISGVAAVILLVLVLLLGGTTLLFFSCLLSLIGLFEFYRAYSRQFKPIAWVGYAMTLAVYVGFYFGMQSRLYTFCFVAGVHFLLAISVFTKYRMVDAFMTFAGFFYIAFPILHINLLYRFEMLTLVWLPFVIAVSTDVFAYVCGKLFGRNKLIPQVSPNKTVEGAVGALICCMLVTGLYAYFFLPNWLIYLPLGVIGSVASQIGDLIASRIKRDTGIKDFGRLIPGHGGVMDRLDSLIAVVPLVYYYTYFVQLLRGV